MIKKNFSLVMMSAIFYFGSAALSAKSSVDHNPTDGITQSSDYKCDACHGTGHDPNRTCGNCNGYGMVKEVRTCDWGCNYGTVIDEYGKSQRCPRCQGAGTIKVDASCGSCNGWGHPTCGKCGGSGSVSHN